MNGGRVGRIGRACCRVSAFCVLHSASSSSFPPPAAAAASAAHAAAHTTHASANTRSPNLRIPVLRTLQVPVSRFRPAGPLRSFRCRTAATCKTLKKKLSMPIFEFQSIDRFLGRRGAHAPLGGSRGRYDHYPCPWRVCGGLVLPWSAHKRPSGPRRRPSRSSSDAWGLWRRIAT